MKKIGICLLVVFLLVSVVSAETKKNLIAVNLQDVELTNVVKFISEVTGKNFIFDETLKGKITIMAPSKISADEAFSLFTSVLNLKGYTLIPAPGNLLKIVPVGQAKALSPEVAEGKATDAYITKLIPLSHISAEHALKFFQPLISKDGHVSVFGTGNYLLLVENALNIQRIEHILSFVDQPLAKDDPELYQIKNGVAEDMAKTINESLQKKDKAVIGGDEIRVMADTRLNALILIGSNYAKESIKKLVALLDIPQIDMTGNIKVYFLENADAIEMAKVLDGVVKGIEEKAKQPQDTKSKVTITADKATNSLIVNAPAGLYQNLLGIIKDLDKRRKQVYVEAMIVEASLDKLKELGSKWRTIARNNGEGAVAGFGTMDSNSMLEIINGLAGMSVGGMGNFFSVPVSDGTTTTNLTIPGFSALFSVNEFRDAVNVLSTPQILTSDNKEAEIIVGENVPFISKRETNTTGTSTGSLFNVIERKDVGIMLKLTPQITEGEYVKLDLYQEISSLKQETNVRILTEVGPTTTKRSTKTSVVVRDNQTVVISGLMQEKGEEIITKVPGLGDIPYLGYLFKFKSVNKTKTNLVVFLTPHIIRNSADLAALSERKKADFTRQMSDDKSSLKEHIEPDVKVKDQ
ncbi:MAG: type II secretion system secretin GspD [Nitrospirae bacterium]|nr:type II secretion system secretin GspD [Nitrospirota bacterium]